MDCGHLIGINCLRQIFNLEYKETPKCPLCRVRIDTWLDISKFGCLRRNGKHDKGGMHFFAIKYDIMGNPTEPETFEGLDEWLHRLEEGEVWTEIWFDVRSKVKQWADMDPDRMWRWMMRRRSGDHPNSEAVLYHPVERLRSAQLDQARN